MKTALSETLFISDLHLSAERPAMIELFQRFVHERAVHADALYILGDFFEYWVGDDDPADELQSVFDAFETLKSNKVPVYFMHGNRDFLVSTRFQQRTGCQLIQDPSVIEISHQKIMLMHGDSLCTDDVKYQEFKKLVRSEKWKDDFTAKPLNERKTIVEDLRKTSKSETSSKNEDIMDVNNQTVNDLLQTQGIQWLIHGHTHRPDIHHLSIENKPATRIVLGDWYDKGSVLVIQSQQNSENFEYKLEQFQ